MLICPICRSELDAQRVERFLQCAHLGSLGCRSLGDAEH